MVVLSARNIKKDVDKAISCMYNNTSVQMLTFRRQYAD